MFNKDIAAEHSVQFFYNCSNKQELTESIEEIRENVKLSAKSVGMLDIWKSSSYDRRGTKVGCVVAMATVFNGMSGKYLNDYNKFFDI